MTENDIFQILDSLVESPLVFAGAIILATFILEDLTTASSAIIASQTDINFFIPLSALFIGIVLGDLGLYFLGKYASNLSFIKNLKSSEKVIRASTMIDKNLVLTVIISRMIPGMRLPTYTAIGALNLSFTKFLSIVLFAVALWSGILFYLFYTLGSAAGGMTGTLKWWVMGAAIAAIVIIPQAIKLLTKRPKT